MRDRLSSRLCLNDIAELSAVVAGNENNHRKEELYQLSFDDNYRVANNAFWIFTHFDDFNNQWLYQKHDDLIDRVIVENNETNCRLMLSLLLRQPFEEESLRSDFIDF